MIMLRLMFHPDELRDLTSLPIVCLTSGQGLWSK